MKRHYPDLLTRRLEGSLRTSYALFTCGDQTASALGSPHTSLPQAHIAKLGLGQCFLLRRLRRESVRVRSKGLFLVSFPY